MTPQPALLERESVAAPAAPKSIVSKLAEIMRVVERVAKRGHNDHFHYDFATESDITAALRKELAARELMLIPNVESLTWREIPTRGGVNAIACAMVAFTIEDGETGQTRTFRVPGEGQDGGDKCVQKALTSAVKYALLKLFLIPTGDDPERTTAPRSQPRRTPTAKVEATPPNVNAETGEEIENPVGIEGFQVANYELKNGWHEADVLKWDAQGGALHVSTKLAKVGEELRRAAESNGRVEVDITMKKGSRGDAYVNRVTARV